jgi:D-alanyl-D-alanine carboxypeptidase (penicillin-binding protein 5/6)
LAFNFILIVMQIFNEFYFGVKNLIKTNKKLTTLIIVIFSISLVLIMVGYKTGIFEKNNSVIASEDMSTAATQKLISDNIEKYGLKTTWLAKNPQNLPVSTKSAVILDYNTGELLFAQNADDKLPPASITKVLTALVALENMKTSKLCTVSQTAADTEPYKIVMRAGEQISVEDLLYGMMMLSANDAAVALSECYDGGSEAFMTKMNERVKLLGLKDSHFVTPNGLDDPEHLTSAYDMAVITSYAIHTQPTFLDYMGRKEDYAVGATEHNDAHYFYSLSTLLQTYSGMDGAKTGFTYEAGNTYIGTAQREGRRIIIVYFGANSTTYDAELLLDQGFFLNPNS